MKKVKIIFDNNLSIVGDGQPISNVFSASIARLNKFIRQNELEERVIVCLTETFKQEGVAELQTRALSKYQSGINSIGLLKGILEDTTITKIDTKDLFDVIKNLFDKKVSEFKIEVLPLPQKTSIIDLSERAISYKAPFEKGDKGFKDTLAWLSIMEDSENNTSFEYILISNDGIFSNIDAIKNEFYGKNHKEILVIKSADSIQEVLDEMLELGFSLEKIKDEVIEKIKEDEAFKNKIKDGALKELSQPHNRLLSSLNLHFLSSYDPEWKSKVVNLIFEDVSANIKNNISKDLFEVEVNVTFIPKYADLDNKKLRRGVGASDAVAVVSDQVSSYYLNNSVYPATQEYKSNLYPKELVKKFTLEYNKANGNKKIINNEEITSNNRLGYIVL